MSNKTYNFIRIEKEVASISINKYRSLFVFKNGEIYNDTKLLYVGTKYFFANNLRNEEYFNFGDEVKSYLYKNDERLFLDKYDTNSLNIDGVILYRNSEITDVLIQDYYYFNFITNHEILLLEKYVGGCILVYSNNNKAIFQSYNILTSLSLQTGNYEWENNLSKHGEIRKILGLVNEKLWVVLYETETRKKQLVSLHTATGKIIDIIDATLPLHDWHIALLEETQTIVSIYGKISTHQKADSPFVEICAITGAVLRNERIESLFQANLKLGQWCYSNHKIYFTAATDTINSTHIGVLDYTTLNLEWFTEVKDRKAGIKDLQVTENKIYALDQGGQLFIFEKEKVVNLKESSE